MRPSAKKFVWVRLGDSCEYEKFDDVASATDMMKEAGVHGPFQWGLRGKVNAPGFEGNNYISCFWGDKDGDFIRELDIWDKAAVEKEI